MLRVARQRAADEGLGNVDFVQADAQVHPFPAAAFDVAVSRTGTMFFADPVAAFRNIGGALRPGGRLAQLVWQPPAGNEWLLSFTRALAAGRPLPTPPPDAPGPFALCEPERVRTVLGAAGFTDIQLEPHSESMWFGQDAAAAERFVLGLHGWMLDGLDDEGRLRAVDNLRTTLAAHDTDSGVLYASATWITARPIRDNPAGGEREGEGNDHELVRRHPRSRSELDRRPRRLRAACGERTRRGTTRRRTAHRSIGRASKFLPSTPMNHCTTRAGASLGF
ncbi:class I SAM-dependent methyltransferase [Streptomyces sp. NPDC059989]|uniref:class I SAM-dependent methyltransferase n=1 Tax=Streptomyces sp. NPDC059989 TaxID=3347026 RepID=UPI0036A33740